MRLIERIGSRESKILELNIMDLPDYRKRRTNGTRMSLSLEYKL